jgi:hypothetical protein
VWVANEAPAVLSDAMGDPWPEGRFVLTCDGQRVAWTDPHGTAIDCSSDSDAAPC